MIDFINFLILLVWSFFKLLFSVMMCCITILVFKPLLQEVSKIISDFWESISWTWEEIRLMENSEYGEGT